MRVLSREGSIGGPDVHDDLRQDFGFHSYSGIHPSCFLLHVLLGLFSALVKVSFDHSSLSTMLTACCASVWPSFHRRSCEHLMNRTQSAVCVNVQREVIWRNMIETGNLPHHFHKHSLISASISSDASHTNYYSVVWSTSQLQAFPTSPTWPHCQPRIQ
jgi:hypothetical protein